ncbi:unnamed protein product [Symbiodinium natans]|uniref:Uncharacterized protein n=1 Tax=Symbiodinium natans TaxID=878477 RepID=A0A812J563_9DINO|nr:unnamed protein product [Symbiodinium natans]
MPWSPRLAKGAAGRTGAAAGAAGCTGWSAAQALGGRRKKAARATETAAHIAHTETPLVHCFVLGGARLDASALKQHFPCSRFRPSGHAAHPASSSSLKCSARNRYRTS